MTGQIYLRRAAEGADCEAEAEVAALRAQGQEGGERGACVAFESCVSSNEARRTGCRVVVYRPNGNAERCSAILPLLWSKRKRGRQL